MYNVIIFVCKCCWLCAGQHDFELQ